MIHPNTPLLPVYLTLLPGPDRKRTRCSYFYRLTYRHADPTAEGCAMTWEVTGGRTAYQIALERDGQGTLRLHCTCADAVFRGEVAGHFCKHVRGLLRAGQQPAELVSLGA